MVLKMKKFQEEFQQEAGRMPEIEEIARALDVNNQKVVEIMNSMETPSSLVAQSEQKKKALFQI